MGNILLIVIMVITLLALIGGVVLMAVGGEKNRKYSTKIMTARVGLQAAALALLVVLFLVGK